MGIFVRELLSELADPPVSAFRDWDIVADSSCHFRVFPYASIHGIGSTLELEQLHGSVRPTIYASRITFEPEGYWTPLDLKACSLVWAIKCLERLYLGREVPHILGRRSAGAYYPKLGPQRASPAVTQVHTPRSTTHSNASRQALMVTLGVLSCPALPATTCH